jgi:TetR/AcrR family transcriptional repressor of nem operon
MRGRPREFDADRLTERVMLAFWRKGYAATSIQDLTDATGASRPTLYAAFRDKEGAYQRALQRYLGKVLAAESAALAAPGDDLDAVGEMLNRLCARLCDASHPAGCLIAQAVLDRPVLDKKSARLVDTIVGTLEEGIETRLRGAQVAGRLNADVTPRGGARLALATIVGLGALARISSDATLFKDATTQLMQLLIAGHGGRLAGR